MHLTIEPQGACEVAPIHLECAPIVMQGNARYPGNQPVGGDRGQASRKRRVPPSLDAPATDQVIALVQALQQLRDICWIILAVAVDSDNDVAAGVADPARESSGLTRIARQSEYTDMRVPLAEST